VAIVDVTAGLFTVNAVLAALHARCESGRGQRLDVSLLESAMAWLANVGSNYLVSGQEPKRYGNAHPNIVPYQSFRAKDRPLALAVANPRQFRRFCELAGRPELADDPRYASNAGRLEHRDELVEAIQSVIEQRTADEWLRLLNDNGIPAGPINTVPQAFADPQVEALGIVHALPHPTAGEVRVVGPPFRFSETPAAPRSAPPLLGEHTESVLRDVLDLDAAAIASLRAEGAI
jgi:formyl-CoA transferase